MLELSVFSLFFPVLQVVVFVLSYKIALRKKSRTWSIFTAAFGFMALRRVTALLVLVSSDFDYIKTALDTVSLPFLITVLLLFAVYLEYKSS